MTYYTLKSKESKALSKEETLDIILKYILQEKEILLKDNISDEDFNSPSWALRQAANAGAVKLCNKLINFLPGNNGK